MAKPVKEEAVKDAQVEDTELSEVPEKKADKSVDLKQPNITELEEILGDSRTVLFFLSWLKNGQNASAAYRELHPDVTSASARVLGSHALARVNKQGIIEYFLATYGIGPHEYFKQLKEGLNAFSYFTITQKDGTVIDRSGPDHQTRAIYHKELKKLLGLESESEKTGGITVAVIHHIPSPDDAPKTPETIVVTEGVA